MRAAGAEHEEIAVIERLLAAMTAVGDRGQPLS